MAWDPRANITALEVAQGLGILLELMNRQDVDPLRYLNSVPPNVARHFTVTEAED